MCLFTAGALIGVVVALIVRTFHNNSRIILDGKGGSRP